MKLRYKAVTPDGKIISGLIEANEIKDAVMYLREKEFIPITVQKQEKSKLLDFIPFLANKVRKKDVVLFTRQLALMLVSGLTLIKALEILKSQTSNSAMSELINNVITDIQEGSSFSKAIVKYEDVFSPIYVSLVRAAESSGLLDQSLSRLADNLEKQQKLRATIVGALTYPVIILVLMIGVIFIIMIFVVPRLTALYADLHVDLPFATQIVIFISKIFVSFWPILIGSIFLFLFLFKRWHKTEEGKVIIDSLIIKIPIIAPLIKKSILAEISRTLGLLVGSGTLVVESLEETADVAGNVNYRDALLDVSRRVEKGVTVGDALSSYSIFPPLLIQLVKVGEQTGKIDETLLKAADYFESEVDQAVKTLTTAMEPLIMVVLGLGVGFLVFSIITPIYKLTSSIQ